MLNAMLTKLVAVVTGLIIGTSSVSAATITITEAHISGDFSTINVSSNITGFADTGDIANQFAILGLQNSANLEEAIAFAELTGYPSTGQSTPDHPVPSPPPPGTRTISIVSAIVDHVLNQFTVTGVLLGDWNVTQASDYTVILGLQNNNNGEESITFANSVTISAPSRFGVASLALFLLTTAGIGAVRRHSIPS